MLKSAVIMPAPTLSTYVTSSTLNTIVNIHLFYHSLLPLAGLHHRYLMHGDVYSLRAFILNSCTY